MSCNTSFYRPSLSTMNGFRQKEDFFTSHGEAAAFCRLSACADFSAAGHLVCSDLPHTLAQFFDSVKDNNNNNVHLSCAHQRPERSHDTY